MHGSQTCLVFLLTLCIIGLLPAVGLDSVLEPIPRVAEVIDLLKQGCRLYKTYSPPHSLLFFTPICWFIDCFIRCFYENYWGKVLSSEFSVSNCPQKDNSISLFRIFVYIELEGLLSLNLSHGPMVEMKSLGCLIIVLLVRFKGSMS